MNQEHAKEILSALAEHFEQGADSVHDGSLLFEDNATLKEHIEAALGGISLEAMSKA